MKIIIFGSNGMLGNYMVTYLCKYYEIIKIDRNIIDAYDASIEKLMDVLTKYKSNEPIFLINCIGVIPQRNNMDDTRKFIKINTLFPHLLSHCCDKLNYQMIHVSTDCVYNGSKGNYSEDDEHDEKNIYGISKSLGEPSNCCVIRTSIIGEESYNKKSLLEWVKSQDGKIINGFVDHYWNGVTCLQLAKIIHFAIQNNIYWYGVRHIYSPSILTKYDLVLLICEKYNLNITVNKLKSDIFNKSLTSKYDSFFNIPELSEQIEELHNFSIVN